MKWIIGIALAIFICTPQISAETVEINTDELYTEQFEQSGVGDIYNELPEETRELLEELNLSPESGELPKIEASDVFYHIGELVKEGFKTPFSTGAAIVGVLLMLTLVSTLGSADKTVQVADFASVMCVATMVLIPLYNTLLTAMSVLKGTASFMMALVPVYCSVLVSGGMTLTAAGTGSLLLGAAEAVVQLVSFGVAPLMGMYLAVSVSASVSPLTSVAGLAELVKKTANWTLSAALTLFLGILSLQTAISASADSIAVKTTRFLASGIPAVGGAVGETVTVVKSSLELLGNSAAGYGVIALAALLLPVIIELLLWRISMSVCVAVCDIFGNKKISGMVKSLDAVFAFLMGVLLYVGLLFIISLAVVMLAGGK